MDVKGMAPRTGFEDPFMDFSQLQKRQKACGKGIISNSVYVYVYVLKKIAINAFLLRFLCRREPSRWLRWI